MKIGHPILKIPFCYFSIETEKNHELLTAAEAEINIQYREHKSLKP